MHHAAGAHRMLPAAEFRVPGAPNGPTPSVAPSSREPFLPEHRETEFPPVDREPVTSHLGHLLLVPKLCCFRVLSG